MATSSKVFVSPGVYTSESELAFVAQSVGVTTLGLVGEALMGPAFEPIFITNYDEYTTYFGGTSPTRFTNTQIPKYEAAYIAKAYLQQSNQLFVTRILGLSGYDAGPSWSITTVGNISGSTVVEVSGTTTGGTYTILFSGTSGSSTSVAITTSTLPTTISTKLDDTYTTPTGGSSTLRDDLETNFYTDMMYDAAGGGTTGKTAYIYGSLSAETLTSITGGTTGTTEAFGVPNINFDLTNNASRSNDSWYYSLFREATDEYTGSGFGIKFTEVTNNGGGSYTGTAELALTTYSGTPIAEYHDQVIATLRSRGITNYDTSDGPRYEVSGLTHVIMQSTGSYSGITSNPFALFNVSGQTYDGDAFSLNTSFSLANSNYLTKVFGKTNFGKSRTDIPLFVDEVYYYLLYKGYNEGKIRGLNTSLINLNGARTDTDNTGLGWKLEKYQTPETPYLVSELRGSKVYDLFKFILISDGDAANQLIKISIANISYTTMTFDVLIRDFNDTDASPVVYEKFTNCTMDSSLNSFVAKKIGTANGDYELKSKYIMLTLSNEYPTDSLPCGFNGYVMRPYGATTNKPPHLVYKTKYNTAGEVIYDPPFSGTSTDNIIRSSGDKVRRTYLGVSNTAGVDSDFFMYKGKQNPSALTTATTSLAWTFLTKGYHMDSGATIVTIGTTYTSSGTTAFEVGESEFRSEPTTSTDTYYKLNSRKFTIAPYGGFDGWDIYREYRTNNDNFKLGATSYRKGAATSISFPTSTGWGAFKEIVGPNQERWANTDYYAYLWGQSTFNNPASININVFTTPGVDYVNNKGLIEDAIDMIETDRADSIYIATCPDYNMFASTRTDFDSDFIFSEDAVDNLETSGIDSNYSATFYPWVLTKDSVYNTQVYIPPTAQVVRNLALTDNIAFPWFASAGYTRGIVNAVKARKKLTQEDRDLLYKGRINPIATFSDVGPVIWGNKTLQLAESPLDRINVRRLLLQARKLISAVAIRLLFEQNDDILRQQFLDSVNPILDSIRRDRGLVDFRVTVSSTVEDADTNTLTGKIYLKPTRALEYIDIEFVITPQGASFEDI